MTIREIIVISVLEIWCLLIVTIIETFWDKISRFAKKSTFCPHQEPKQNFFLEPKQAVWIMEKSCVLWSNSLWRVVEFKFQKDVSPEPFIFVFQDKKKWQCYKKNFKTRNVMNKSWKDKKRNWMRIKICISDQKSLKNSSSCVWSAFEM